MHLKKSSSMKETDQINRKNYAGKNRLIWGWGWAKENLKKKKRPTHLELVSVETLEDIFINQEQDPMKK